MLHDDDETNEGGIVCNAWIQVRDVLHLHDRGHFC